MIDKIRINKVDHDITDQDAQDKISSLKLKKHTDGLLYISVKDKIVGSGVSLDGKETNQ